MIEPAANLTLIVPPELSSGFRIAGTDVMESPDTGTTEEILERLVTEGGRGVVGVYSDFYSELDESLRERIERSVAPIVIPLPSGLEPDRGVSQRARVAALLERAVGYHITFDEGGVR